MAHLNVEIKAYSTNHDKIRGLLNMRNAEFKGIDHQIDTYFHVPIGRLKLREGDIENFLIHYLREDRKDAKDSNVILYKTNQDSALKEILKKSLGVLAVVDKKREIYFIDNVKFHLDEVLNLGSFVEIEAIDKDLTIGRTRLLKQCDFYKNLFGIDSKELISCSYSDMILRG